MFKNYLNIAFRNLWRERLFSGISIAGLGAGIAVSVIIVQYVIHEWSYNEFHENSEKIFRVVSLAENQNKITSTFFSARLGPQLAKDNPGIEGFTRLQHDWGSIIKNPDKPGFINEESGGIFADPSLFSIFSFPLKLGNAADALARPFTIVISEKFSEKYFGMQNPLGKKILYNNQHLFEITGVAANLPTTSTIQFDYVSSLETLAKINQFAFDNLPNFDTFILLKSPASITAVTRNIKAANKLLNPLAFRETDNYRLEPMSELRFDGTMGSNGQFGEKILYIFSGTAALILLLALFNYINLATARATIRAKEVGVRKAIGANRLNLIKQFFTESAIVTFLAFVSGSLLVIAFRAPFNEIFGLHIDPSLLITKTFLATLLTLYIGTTFLAGFYPALMISRFSPVKVLKGNYTDPQGTALRSTFMVFQFTVSVVMMLCSLVIWQQVSYLQNKDLGFNTEQILNVRLGKTVSKKSQEFKREVASQAGMGNVSLSNTRFFNSYASYGVKVGAGPEVRQFVKLTVDEDFPAQHGLKWKLTPDINVAPESAGFHIVVNETAAKELGYTLENITGQPVMYEDGIEFGKIAGVVRDFHLSGPQQKIPATLLLIKKVQAPTNAFNNLHIKLNPGEDLPGKIANLEKIFRKYDIETPFQYSFLDDDFRHTFESYVRISGMARIFTALAVLLACLGLFGLITFIAQTRLKEISIRKILGASVISILSLLSRDFLLLILISILLACPIAYYAMNQWLLGFPYRIELGWGVFIFAGLSTIAIALVTISFQCIKAALTNPVESLRSE